MSAGPDRANLSVGEALDLFGPVVTAIMLLRALDGRVSEEGTLFLDGDSCDDLSLVVAGLDEVLEGEAQDSEGAS